MEPVGVPRPIGDPRAGPAAPEGLWPRRPAGSRSPAAQQDVGMAWVEGCVPRGSARSSVRQRLRVPRRRRAQRRAAAVQGLRAAGRGGRGREHACCRPLLSPARRPAPGGGRSEAVPGAAQRSGARRPRRPRRPWAAADPRPAPGRAPGTSEAGGATLPAPTPPLPRRSLPAPRPRSPRRPPPGVTAAAAAVSGRPRPCGPGGGRMPGAGMGFRP